MAKTYFNKINVQKEVKIDISDARTPQPDIYVDAKTLLVKL